jgi:AcrR family transcriptional regulator
MEKRRILQVASELFSRSGLKSISVDVICHSLGIAKKTYYLVYRNKDELVSDYIHEFFVALFRELQQNTTSADAVERLKIFDAYLVDRMSRINPAIVSDLKRYHNSIYQIFVNNQQKLVGKLSSIIELGKRQGAFRKNLDAQILAELRFNEIKFVLARRGEIAWQELHRQQQQLFEHYLAGLTAKM